MHVLIAHAAVKLLCYGPSLCECRRDSSDRERQCRLDASPLSRLSRLSRSRRGPRDVRLARVRVARHRRPGRVPRRHLRGGAAAPGLAPTASRAVGATCSRRGRAARSAGDEARALHPDFRHAGLLDEVK